MLLMIPVRKSFQLNSRGLVSFDNSSMFCLAFPIPKVSSPQFIGVLQGIAAGIGISNFLRALFMVCLMFSSSGSMKKIPRNCPALSSFGFSMIQFCFALRFAASDKCFHISGHPVSGLEVVRFLVSVLPRTVYIRQVAFRSIKWILWNLSMHLIILFLHPHSSNHQDFSPTMHP